MRVNTERLKEDIEALANFVDKSQIGWTRRAFTPFYEEARGWLKDKMKSLNLEVNIDAAANVIGTLPGKEKHLPVIMIGSHIDTVKGGGRFDGIIGVVAGLEIVRLLKENGIQLRHPLQVVDFTAEEPSEFGISTIGSRGMVNNLPETMLFRKDLQGITLREALKRSGGDPERLTLEARKPGDVALYLELHIEQGPVLEQTNHQLGVVRGIAGIQRYRLTVEGEPNHAGTTPMNLRKDALTAAAEIILCFEQLCQETYTEEVVGTVGKLMNEPNAANVIPGKVTCELEIRSLDKDIQDMIISQLHHAALQISKRRGVSVQFDCLSQSEPILVQNNVRSVIEQACKEVAPTMFLSSGAGHDANQIARIAPIGMIFVPSKNGRSHCPEEWTDYEDVALGVQALLKALLLFDQQLD
jgi:beta-ureidopropionase / N-carbamoyl-L-amino-acid hydrolase